MPSPADFILTKILATVGPACRDAAMLQRLIHEGARVFRINFSHGSFDDFEQSLRQIRQAAAAAEIPVGVLGDLSGPKIRLNEVENNAIELAVGDPVEFTRQVGVCRREADTGVTVLSTNYPAMISEVEPGHRVFIDDGNVRMLAVEREGRGGDDRLDCRVTTGGTVSTRKGVNLPDSDISAPSLTEWDRQCAAWAIEHELDFLALSFVRRAADLRDLRDLLRSFGRSTPETAPGAVPARGRTRLPIIAKLEKPQAIHDLQAIVQEADGIMVARGDLGVEMDLAEVPIIQKRIINVAHDYGKPVIVATQMLQSMIEDATPTRAEVSDVANAILDGADAVMLSGETAVGQFPQQTVQMMARTARITEDWLGGERKGSTRPPKHLQTSRYRTAALAHGVSVICNDLHARYVVTWSELGGGARHLSQNRLAVPILAISSNEAALRQMSLMFGVTPIYMERPSSTEAFVHAVDALICSNGWGDPGDAVIMAKGEPLGTPGVMNQIRIHYLGDVCRLMWHAKPK